MPCRSLPTSSESRDADKQHVPCARDFAQKTRVDMMRDANTVELLDVGSQRAHAARRAIEGTTHMRVGVPKEVKSDEYRVAMMPVGAELMVKAGHEVYVEKDAGSG